MTRFILSSSLALATWLSPSASQAQTTAGNTALVRVREAGGWSNVIVTYGAGHTEVAELKLNPNTKGQRENAEQLQAIFDKLFAAGYVLQGSFNGGDENSISTLIFRKPER